MGVVKVQVSIHLTSYLLDDTSASICGEDDNGCYSWFKCSVKKGETFDIKHMNFINEQNTWDQLGNTLINVFVYHFVNLQPQLFCYVKEETGTSLICTRTFIKISDHSSPFFFYKGYTDNMRINRFQFYQGNNVSWKPFTEPDLS